MKLSDLRKLAEARTKGAWKSNTVTWEDDEYGMSATGPHVLLQDEGENYDEDLTQDQVEKDAAFIAAMANHIDALLDALDLAQQVNDDLRKAGFTMVNEKLYHALAKLESI